MKTKLSFSALCLLLISQLMSFAQPSPGDGGTGTNDTGTVSQPAFGYTNGFWIDITSPTTNPWPLVLHGTSDWQDYQLLSKTNLGDPTWVFETNVVGVSGTNVTPVSIDLGTRSNLFIQAIPTPSSMGLTTGAGYFDSQTISLPVNGGPSAGMGFLVNSTDFSSAQWVNYSPSVDLFLGSTNGTYDVWFGFIGAGDTTNWQKYTVTVDTSAPVLTVTGPASGTISKPVIQITGYSDKQLSDVSCTVSNSVAAAKNIYTLILNQYYDTNVATFTTNWFQCFDVGLTNGTNVVTVSVRDLAGNITVSNLTYILDYSSDATAPQIALSWPQDGTYVSGTSFTLRGSLDDETANITVQVANSGVTNVVSGLVERNGMFWVENVPLRELNWYWTASATKTTNGWVLDPGSSNSVDPSDYNTTTFPEWTINTHAFIWGPE